MNLTGDMYGPTRCPDCGAGVQVCVLIRRGPDNRMDTDAVTLDPDQVPKPVATVVRLTVRPDQVWIVTPVERLAELPSTFASVARTYFKAHVCNRLPRNWVDSHELVSAGQADA